MKQNNNLVMALEVEEVGQEGKGKGKEVSSIPKEVSDLINGLKEQIDELKKSPEKRDDAASLERLANIIEGRNNPSNDRNFSFEQNYASEQDLDPADVLPQNEWVTFIQHSVGTVIVDDLRNGKPVRVPFGKIEFTYESTKAVKNGKEHEVHNFCKYTCKSKKELQWLRGHSLYNIIFFENIKGAMSTDASKAMKLATVVRGLSSMGSHDIIHMAKSYGIEMHENVNAMRGEIALKLVEEQMKDEAIRTQRILNDTNVDRLMLEKD